MSAGTPKTRRVPKRSTPKPRTAKPVPADERASRSDVQLVPVPGTAGKGAGPAGEKWRIDYRGQRAGEVFINVIDEAPVGRHASIQIYLNAKSQGRGIGRLGYELACRASQHSVIYAHMRKSNLPSRKAAEAAGFVDATPPGMVQLLMKWTRR